MMANLGKHRPVVLRKETMGPWPGLVIICHLVIFGQVARGGTAEDGEALIVRLVHPDRQAAEVLSFLRARANTPPRHWRRGRKGPINRARSGSRSEALIAFFNPEMTREWRALHAAELCVNWDDAVGRPRWHAIVTKDDGTVAAGVTSLRLTDGTSEAPDRVRGKRLGVERLGRPGRFLATQVGDTVIFGSTRDELVRAIGRMRRGDPQRTGIRTPRGRADEPDPVFSGASEPLESGVIFELEPDRLAASHAAALPVRMTGAMLARDRLPPDCTGRLALKGDCAGLEVTTLIHGDGRARAALWRGTATVLPAWLEWMPSAGAMAAVSLAFEPGQAYWDTAFELMDRAEKTDPARAGLAPLRARINLLAAAASVRLEADLVAPLEGPDRRPPGRTRTTGATNGWFARLASRFRPCSRTARNAHTAQTRRVVDSQETRGSENRAAGDQCCKRRETWRFAKRLRGTSTKGSAGRRNSPRDIPALRQGERARPFDLASGRDVLVAWGTES